MNEKMVICIIYSTVVFSNKTPLYIMYVLDLYMSGQNLQTLGILHIVALFKNVIETSPVYKIAEILINSTRKSIYLCELSDGKKSKILEFQQSFE